MGIRRALEEVILTLNLFILFDVLLSTIIVFLITYQIFSFVNISRAYAVWISIIFLLARAIPKLSRDKLSILEKNYDFLDQKMHTARDYLNVKNPFIPDLHEEIKNELNQVETKTFFRHKRVSLKVVAIIFICFLIVTLAPFHYTLFDFNKVIDIAKSEYERYVIKESTGFRGERGDELRDSTVRADGQDSDIYGVFKIAALGDEEIEVKIAESSFELSSSVINEPEQKQFEDVFPDHISIRSAESYESSIAKENQEIVKNYFKEITK